MGRMLVVVLWLCAGSALAASAGAAIEVHGSADGKAPAWTISSTAPPGWTTDCCTYARAIGVNEVLYQGEWTGKPDRVMVLNVWPSKLPTLDAELQDDRKHYLQADPAGKVVAFPVKNPRMPCSGVLYSGSDHVDDPVVFCDPGAATGIRYSWSMTVSAVDPSRESLLDAFRQVVAHSRYANPAPTSSSAGKAH
ncbi:hypothetical protein ISP15_12110 [Dyella jejuensis]|uniref:Uncharacterized protein n=2 Tax=Dyella jejuensis TaxID=1432009 RepID=A0ABW8JJ15_9GAMM